MRNKFRKAIKCELRHSFKKKLSLERKYTNEVSVFTLQLNMNSYGI